jgi:cytoskeleton protein RodZ
MTGRGGKHGASAADDDAVAPRAGAELREARERLEWSLQDVSGLLRIRQTYLDALEQGQLNPIPANAYALGFLRTYATALGLNAEETVRRFRAEAAEMSAKTNLSFPTPMPERGLPSGAIILMGAVLAVGIYVGWYRLSGEGKLPAETAIALPERLAVLAEQAIPATRPHVVPANSFTAQGPTLLVEPQPSAPSISPSSAAAAPVSAHSAMALQSGLPDQTRIVLRASADSWIQVRDRAGTVLFNRVLKPGESWPVPPKSSLLMTTGNAGGTELLVDGVVTPSLGQPGVVRRDLALDPDLIKEGKLGVQPAPMRAHQ